MTDSRLLDALIFEIFEAAAADRAACLANHAARVLLADSLNPVVRQPQEPMPDKMHRETLARAADEQFLERSPRTGKVTPGDQGDDPLDLAGLEHDSIPPFP